MLKDRILSAVKNRVSDLVIEDVQIADVFNQEIYTADVAVTDGYFAGIGVYKGYGAKRIDGTGKIMVPGLIDAHAHIESTLVTPVEYANASLPHGITSVIADPHEIANVSGIKGIRYMIENAAHALMDIYFMLPSCVPATSFENAGAVLKAADLKPLYGHESVKGLAEVMDVSAVLKADPDMLRKIEDAAALDLTIDGHGAGFTEDQLNGYAAAHIRTDHECDTASGLVDRVRRGIYTLVREGTVCKDLLKMLPAINEKNARMLCFSTNDKHLDDLMVNGGVNVNVKLAAAHGLNPLTALQIGSLNAARCYRLKDKGAIAPGYVADFSLLSDLKTFTVEQVFKNGRLVAKNGKLIHRADPGVCRPDQALLTSICIPEIRPENLAVPMGDTGMAHVIEVVKDSVVTNHLMESVDVESGFFVPSISKDQLKIAVIERHKNTGNVGTGILKGLKLKQGAIATTVAHDSHNLMVAGTNDADMVAAVRALQQMHGGIVVVDGRKVAASLSLEVAGLITSRPAGDVIRDLARLKQAVERIAPDCGFNPFLALAFMSLVVIPHLKISDQGLFEFSRFEFIKVPVPQEGKALLN